jgi:hypothetical protein
VCLSQPKRNRSTSATVFAEIERIVGATQCRFQFRGRLQGRSVTAFVLTSVQDAKRRAI